MLHEIDLFSSSTYIRILDMISNFYKLGTDERSYAWFNIQTHHSLHGAENKGSQSTGKVSTACYRVHTDGICFPISKWSDLSV